MANEAEQAIYSGLRAAPVYHPVDVTLLPDDWALEAGDVVTVRNAGENYSVPVFSLDYTWKGGLTAEAQSTGNQKREALSALKKRYYGGGGGGGAWAASIMDKKFDLLASKVEWDNLKNGNKTMNTKLSETDGKVGGIITNVGEDGVVTAKTIVDKINLSGDTVQINANHIILNGQAVADSLVGKDVDVKDLSANLLSVSNGFSLSTGQTGGFSFNGNSIGYHNIKIGTSSSLASVPCLMGGSADVTLAHAHAMTMDTSGNVTAGAAVPVGDSSATFNVAATAWFQQQMADAISTGWNNAAENTVVPTTQPSSLSDTLRITYPVTGGTTTTQMYTLNNGYWNTAYTNPRRVITLRIGGTTSSQIAAQTYIEMPASGTWGGALTVSPPSAYASVTASFTVNGKTYTHTYTHNGS